MLENRTIRVNIRISEELKKFFEYRSLQTGIAQSSLMAFALEDYVSKIQKKNIKE